MTPGLIPVPSIPRPISSMKKSSSVPRALIDKEGMIAVRTFRRRGHQPLPLVAVETPCLLRERMLQALDQSGIPWRITLVSPSLSGLWAGASAGLGLAARGDLGFRKTWMRGKAVRLIRHGLASC